MQPYQVQVALSTSAISCQARSTLPLSGGWQVRSGAVPSIKPPMNGPNQPPADADLESLRMQLDQVGHIIAPAVSLNPLESATLHISCPQPFNLNDNEIARLKRGHAVILRGLVSIDRVIRNNNIPRVVKLIAIVASFVQSSGSLLPASINLGAVGHSSRWRDVPISLEFQNKSDIRLVCDPVQLPPPFSTPKTMPLVVLPRGSIKTQLFFSPTKVRSQGAGVFSWKLTFRNVYNPENLMVCTVTAQIALSTVHLSGLTDDRVLQLPPLQVLSSRLSATDSSMEEQLSGHSSSRFGTLLSPHRERPSSGVSDHAGLQLSDADLKRCGRFTIQNSGREPAEVLFVMSSNSELEDLVELELFRRVRVESTHSIAGPSRPSGNATDPPPQDEQSRVFPLTQSGLLLV